MKNSLQRIPSLDGIRGVVSWLVVLTHTQVDVLIYPPAFVAVRELGHFAVTAFFFLSGFIITLLLRNEYERKGTINFSNFFLRRFYRLAPPFFLTMLGVFLIAQLGIVKTEFTWPNFMGQLLQVSNYMWGLGNDQMMRDTGSIVIWSLAVENHFYLVFPVVLLAMLRWADARTAAIAILIFCALVAVWRWYAWFELELSRNWIKHATDTRIDSILAGCFLALWRSTLVKTIENWQQPLGTIVTLICIAAILMVPLSKNEVIAVVAVYPVQCICLFIVCILAMKHPDWYCFRWLNSRVMLGLGAISYTVYLIHLPMLKVMRVRTDWDVATMALVATVLTLVLATLSYHYVEKPCARLRRKLH